jgi:hypothetical protein
VLLAQGFDVAVEFALFVQVDNADIAAEFRIGGIRQAALACTRLACQHDGAGVFLSGGS